MSDIYQLNRAVEADIDLRTFDGQDAESVLIASSDVITGLIRTIPGMENARVHWVNILHAECNPDGKRGFFRLVTPQGEFTYFPSPKK